MKLEAIVHPTSISRNDPKFDPSIHIPVEVLASSTFKKKMIGLPVTAYHHDTMKAVNMIYRRREKLSADTMRKTLIELNESQPGPLQLARQVLKRRKVPASVENIWQILPEVISHARGPGVLGTVTDFWRSGDQWLVAVEIDAKKISSFQMKLIKKGGALGEISLTHAVLDDGVIEPLELSFTIQGLRTGSAINRIVSASAKHHLHHLLKMADIVEQKSFPGMETDLDSIPSDPIRIFYDKLDPALQSDFVSCLANVKQMSTKCSSVNEARLADLEKAMNLVQEATANALNELGPTCFGSIRPRSKEDWTRHPESLATANEFILAAAANSLNKRKRDNDELDEALKDITGGGMSNSRVVAASRASKPKDTTPDDDFFRELRSMRQALKALP